jgi:RNA polymerase sigma-70 factor (ECF subfamily)
MSDPARKPRLTDIHRGMADESGRETAGGSDAGHGHLTPAEFAKRFEDVSRTLWCIAAAVLGDRSAADDVLQESAMIALGKLDQFDQASNFLAWMARIVRFVALNHGRRRVAASPSVDPHSLESTAATSDLAGASHHVRMHTLNGQGQLNPDQPAFDDHVLAALASLESGARACLLLRVVLDMPYRDIARTLDMAEGTAMSHVHRARMTLRETLGPRYAGGDHRRPGGQAGGRHA